jgi:hypothetical protein
VTDAPIRVPGNASLRACGRRHTMLPTMMRAIWALAVVCLLAATGMQPVRAGETEARPAVAQLVDRHPGLPAVAAARHTALVVAGRPDAAAPALPPTVLADPPSLALRVAHAFTIAPHRAHAPGSASVPTRSARGPPAC